MEVQGGQQGPGSGTSWPFSVSSSVQWSEEVSSLNDGLCIVLAIVSGRKHCKEVLNQETSPSPALEQQGKSSKGCPLHLLWGPTSPSAS